MPIVEIKQVVLDKLNTQEILGVEIDALTLSSASSIIESWIETRASKYVCVTPAHGVMDCYNQPALREIFNSSGMTTPDGMAIVWLLKLYGHKDVSRVYGPDLVLAVCEAGLKKGWRHFFYGGNEGVAEKLGIELQHRFPGLEVAGHYCPPFRSLTTEESAEVTVTIREAKPDIVWVGLSTPKQEVWMADFVDRLEVPVLVGVGAAFDFLTGTKKQAPRWVQRSGLEWLFRLLSEPGRLWRRYIQYPKFVYLALGQWLGVFSFNERGDV
jgi:N-acetylglucosaminyldiphosphoundecaprenol N-acetyl-beta-D-mannosaminyltransferase